MTLSTSFLLHALVASLCIIGIHASTWNRMINEWVTRIHLSKNPCNPMFLPDWITYPLYDCPICMASMWGLWFSFLFHIEVIQIPVFCLTIAGINTIFVVLKWIADK